MVRIRRDQVELEDSKGLELENKGLARDRAT